MRFEFLTAAGEPCPPDQRPARFSFECPKHPDQMCTGLVIRGAGLAMPGATWAFDGNREAPTFSPSINCGGCSHGYIENGVWRDA